MIPSLLFSLMLASLYLWIRLRIGPRDRRAAEFFLGVAFFSCAALMLSFS